MNAYEHWEKITAERRRAHPGIIHANVTCQECGHRSQWDIAMSPGTVQIPCVGCKEILDVEITQDVIDKANHKLPASLSMWEVVIKV